MSRTIAVTTLLDGKIEIGEEISVSTTLVNIPRRSNYRGLVFDIRTWPDGLDYAGMVVLGMKDPIWIRLEKLDEPDA